MSIKWHIVLRSCSMWVLWSVFVLSFTGVCFSGWSALSPDEKHIVVSNLYDGLDFYSISDRAVCYSVPCPINQNKNKPVPVLFSNDGKVVMVGGTSGSARILDSGSCETLQTLSHNGRLCSFIQKSPTDKAYRGSNTSNGTRVGPT